MLAIDGDKDIKTSSCHQSCKLIAIQSVSSDNNIQIWSVMINVLSNDGVTCQTQQKGNKVVECSARTGRDTCVSK